MEVAGQWRREWAGTAEYGKVTEGGVTRHVARAMEVLHASAPGARVRVMRAAYHSSAGPGLPAVSSMMHSSRRVISSGFNLLESPTTPSKPLEISSTPFDTTPEYNTDTENYKVTEPDDFEISEPSKWRSSTGGNSIRMPSEESSSTDNASIIDLDSRHHRSVLRKHSYDSENSDIPLIPLSRKSSSSRLSPLLDAPTALSTLKYKSLLNGSNDWVNRRKSYSFEDTSPLNETIIHSNDTLAMESSTDSGICKSTEIVNEPDDKFIDQKDNKYFDKQEETFKDWLSKNRPCSSFYKGHHIKSKREHDVVIEEPLENAIALQSKGKVTITVPIKIETDKEYQYRKSQESEDRDRKIKKVGFCKTELHFAVETGKVNIIATDEKPPPSNDFRKRRSAFVPINGNFEKPITLFGETNKDFLKIRPSEFSTIINNETGETDENAAATKSILKNKIPKPKPYLLGENMVFGSSDDVVNKNDDTTFANVVPTAVSLINRQLQERRYSNETTSSDTDIGIIKNNAIRTTNKGPQINDTFKLRKTAFEVKENTSTNNLIQESNPNCVKNKLRTLQMSPISGRAKTRQLRDSDLTYFGVDSSPRQSITETPKYVSKLQFERSSIDDIFQSVKLIQRVSNSVCNSEAESEDAPEYQNIPVKTNFAPVPTPRTRSKYDNNLTDSKEMKVLRPIIEQANDASLHTTESRRSRARRQDDSGTFSTRSISAPPKSNMYNFIEKPTKQELRSQVLEKMSPLPRSRRNHVTEGRFSDIKSTPTPKHVHKIREVSDENEPLYVNLNAEEKKVKNAIQRTDSIGRKLEEKQKVHAKVDTESSKGAEIAETRKSRSHRIHEKPENKDRVKSASRADTNNIEKNEDSVKKTNRVKRTEKLSTPDYSNGKIYNSSNSNSRRRSSSERTDDYNNTRNSKQEHRSRSAQRRSTKENSERTVEEENKQDDRKDSKYQTIIEEDIDVKYRTRNSSKDKTVSRKEANQTKTPHKIEAKSESTHHSMNSKGREKIIMDKVPNGKQDSKASKRSEYVINYDDKNGTVLSICKVPGSSTSKKKKAIRDRGTDSLKDHKMKNKTSEKIALLQLPEHQWDPYEMSYADRKWKRKLHVQRTCQLL